MNLTLGQKVAMVSVLLGVLAGATAQLTPIFGSAVATSIASFASLANTVISGWIFILTGQANTVKAVADMPGVEKITINERANQTLAAVAVDPTANKVAPTNAAFDQVTETAKGTA